MPWDEAASCVLLSEGCSAPWTSASFWPHVRNPTDAEFRSTDKTRSFASAPLSRQRVCEVGLESRQTRCDEAAVRGTPRAWGTRWLGRGAAPASWRIRNSAQPRAGRGPEKQGRVRPVHLGRQPASKVHVRIHHGKTVLGQQQELRKSAECFWKVSQTMWGSDFVNLGWLLILWWRILYTIMLKMLSEA